MVETTKLERCCSWRPELRKATVEDKSHSSSSNISTDDGDSLEKDLVFRNMMVVCQNSMMIILLLNCGLMDGLIDR